jgi:hypothetical protein
MLSAWRTNIIPAMINAHPVKGIEPVDSHAAKGRTAAAESEPTEEYSHQHSIKT